ncbi:hypothetical protein QZH41_010993 [Actinostola sp. cb2023]|nr:hypothetical protein QZH41_010993 [Actinostola sp. cb2023]
MFTALKSVSKMKKSIKKGDRSESRSSTSASVVIETPEIFIQGPLVLFGEPYTPTGNFEADFRELCIRAGFSSMQVVPRPQRPPTPSTSPLENITTTGKSTDKNSAKDEPIKQDGGTSPGEPEHTLPSTYLVKEKYNYFQPRVEVEVDEEGNKTYVREMYIRGWKIDDRVLEILAVTLPPLDKLTKIDLWNNGLTDNSLNILASAIQNLPNLRTLCLDNNPLTLQRYGVLLGEESTMLGYGMMMARYGHRTGLRMNRTLLSLNLGSNLISDAGASKIAEVISSFSLSHEEIIARRLLISKKSPDDVTSPSRSLNAPTGGSKERPASVRSGGHLTKEERKSREKERTSKKKEGKKQDEKAKKTASVESVKAPAKGKKSAASKGDKKGIQQPEQEVKTIADIYNYVYVQPEVVEFPNPLLEMPLKEEGGDIVIPGNRALININLSRNKIGETGVEAFLIAIQRQIDIVSILNKPTGLMRLTLTRNLFSPSNGSYQRLMEIMQTRDPYYKPPDPIDDTFTTIKVHFRINCK